MPQLARLGRFTLVLLPFIGASPVLAAASAKAGDVVISVGVKSIRRGQIDTIVDLMAKAQAMRGEVSAAQRQDMKKLVATNLIGQELLEMEAKALHTEATPKEVDSLLQTFKNRFPDEASFKKALKEAGDTEAKVRLKLARQIRADKVLAARVKRPEIPSEKEMQAFWEQHKKEFPVNDSLRALQIMLLADDKTPKETAEKKRNNLASLRKELVRDSALTPLLLQRFMTAAAQFSEGPEAKTGGDLQRFNPKDLNLEFRKQVQALKVGQISSIFKTSAGFHIVLLIEKYDGKFDSYKLQVIQNLMNQKTAAAGGEMRKLLKGLAAKYPVKYLNSGYKDSTESGIY